MLPEELSTGASSLLENQSTAPRWSSSSWSMPPAHQASDVYRAIVRNKAQLTYNAVGAWLEGTAAAPPKIAASADLQAATAPAGSSAQALKKLRYEHGALNIETAEVIPCFRAGTSVSIDVVKQKNRATELIEDFMIAANGVVARMLEKVSSLRRIVKTPEHWDRIVRLAAAQGEDLPAHPDSKALNDFLLKRKAADPDHFADLSLAVIKLMGPANTCWSAPAIPSKATSV
jgi:exoribonuclease R